MAAKYQHMSEVVYEYVEELDSNLICAICQSALVDPVTTTACKHTFCRDCIEKAIAVNPQCPIDRSALTVGGLRETEQLVKLMLDELNVRCTAEGCGKVMQRGLLLSHSRTCLKAIMTCPDDGCGLSMAAHRLPHHRAYECFKRKMACGKCDVLLTFKEAQTHQSQHSNEQEDGAPPGRKCSSCDETINISPNLHKWTCPAHSIACTHSARGCPAILARRDLASHLSTCPFEALGAYFEVNDARMKSMEEKQNELQTQVQDLRRELNRARQASMQRQAVEQSFTGVSSPLDAAILRQGGMSSASVVDAGSGAGASTRDGTRVGGSAGTSPNRPNNRPNNNLNLNRYDDTARHRSRPPAPVLGNGRNMFSPSFGSHQTFADWAFQRLSDIPSGNGSRDELVCEMRAVLLHLASALDSMERRNEVRTMTETLRVQEEVGSLRAIVNTMRMQVMTDRPTFRSPISIATRVPITIPSSSAVPVHGVVTAHDPQDRSVDGESESSFSTANDGAMAPSGIYVPPSTGPLEIPDNLHTGRTLPRRESGPRQAEVPGGGGESGEGQEAVSIVESIVFSPHHPPSGTSSIVTSPAEDNGGWPVPGPRSNPNLYGLGVGNGVGDGNNTEARTSRPTSRRSANRTHTRASDYATIRSSPQTGLGAMISGGVTHMRSTTTVSGSASASRSDSIATGGTGSSSLAAAYNAALRGMSNRSAERSASVIGGVGGVVGQPMGLPRTSTLGDGVGGGAAERGSGGGTGRSNGVGSSRSTSRLGGLSRAVSSSLNSIRNAGRSGEGDPVPRP